MEPTLQTDILKSIQELLYETYQLDLTLLAVENLLLIHLNYDASGDVESRLTEFRARIVEEDTQYLQMLVDAVMDDHLERVFKVDMKSIKIHDRHRVKLLAMLKLLVND